MNKIKSKFWDVNICDTKEMDEEFAKTASSKTTKTVPEFFMNIVPGEKVNFYINKKVQNKKYFLTEVILIEEMINAEDLETEENCAKRAHEVTEEFFKKIYPYL